MNSKWLAMLNQGQEELPPIPMRIDDATNAPVVNGTPMVPKSMSVQVKRPLGYARPAQPDETLESLLAKYGDASDRALKSQNEGVDKLEGQLGNLKQTLMPDSFAGRLSGVNLAPLMAYADSMAGTNTAQAYERPEPMAERQKMILQLEDAIQKRRGDVAKSEADALKEKISFYLKDKDDPMKDLMALTRVNYMNAMADAAGKRLGEQEQNQFSKSEDAKILKASMKFNNDLETYERLVKKYGSEVAGERRQELDTAYNELGLSYKEAKNLGALTGPDWEIVKGAIAPSTGVTGLLKKITGGGSQGALKGIKQIKKNTKRDIELHTGSAKTFYNPTLVDTFKANITPKNSVEAPVADDAAMQRYLELKKKYNR